MKYIIRFAILTIFVCSLLCFWYVITVECQHDICGNYQAGYDDGREDTYELIFNQAYKEGYQNGQKMSYDNAFRDGKAYASVIWEKALEEGDIFQTDHIIVGTEAMVSDCIIISYGDSLIEVLGERNMVSHVDFLDYCEHEEKKNAD